MDPLLEMSTATKLWILNRCVLKRGHTSESEEESSNASEIEEESSNASEIEEEPSSTKESEEEPSNTRECEEAGKYEVVPVCEENPSVSAVSRPFPARKRRKLTSTYELARAILDIERQKLSLIKSQLKKPLNDDENFFNSLLPQIRTLSAKKKFLFQMDVQRILHDYCYNKEP